MDTSKLRERLRDVVLADPVVRPVVPSLPALASVNTRRGPETVLGGEHRDGALVIEQRVDPSVQHGHWTVGALSEALARSGIEASLIAGGASPCPPFVFFDLETTGLNGGAGTYAFLIGCGWFDEGGAFWTRQHLLTRFSDEPLLLAGLANALRTTGTLVTFNGKSFDAPLLETRYLCHRLDWFGGLLPHVDVLHAARQFWGASCPCSLTALEGEVLGFRRRGDIQGFEAPARYFQFVRSGDPQPLVPVLAHNRMDLLSLAGLTARVLDLIRSGADAAAQACEALALGRLYGRAGREGCAMSALERAVALATGAPGRAVAVDALRALAAAFRRARRHEDAARCWSRLLHVGCPSHVRREACEALAIHHEHRVHDLTAAKGFALRSLEGPPRERWTSAVRHRLARIERKEKTLPMWPLE